MSCLFLSQGICSIYFSSCVILLVIPINLKVRLKGESSVGGSTCASMRIWVWVLSSHIRYLPIFPALGCRDRQILSTLWPANLPNSELLGKAKNEKDAWKSLSGCHMWTHVHVIPPCGNWRFVLFPYVFLSSDFSLGYSWVLTLRIISAINLQQVVNCFLYEFLFPLC